MKIIKDAVRIINLLSLSEKEILKQRCIQRFLSIKKQDLLPPLDLLLEKKIILWDEVNKTVSFHTDKINNLELFSSDINSYLKKIKNIKKLNGILNY